VESGIWLGGVVLGEKEAHWKTDHKRGKDKNSGQDKDKDQSPLIRNIPNQTRRDNPKTRRDNPKIGSDDKKPHDLGTHDLGMHAPVVLELGQRLLTKLKLQ